MRQEKERSSSAGDMAVTDSRGSRHWLVLWLLGTRAEALLCDFHSLARRRS